VGVFSVGMEEALRRLRRERKGTAAVEFALVGSAFFLIFSCLFILSLDMYWQFTMDTAVRAAVRQVQIGKVTTGSGFVAAVCSELGLVAANCTGTLQYSVQSGTFFGDSTHGIIGSAGTLTSTGLSNPANFSTITATATGTPQFLLAQVAMPVPFNFFGSVTPVVTQNGTSYLYSSVATVVEP
jgi:Flp pilus assembly protein TadG